ncbi:MAG TPA: methyltransferase domain-containing protein [Methylococcales bacterium]
MISVLEDFISTIDAFNETRPDMDGVRAYNHQMVEILNQLNPVAGKALLDVGASPHGYTLEHALQLGVSRYVGIGLAVADEAVEVRHQNYTGRLIKMNAEDLAFEPDTFDLILSLSTFEHFFNGSQVLREMYRVLKPGGRVLINFQPVWTSSYGHHLHHIPDVAELIPAWAHLLWTEETMMRACTSRWPADASMSLRDTVQWIYKSDEINRVDIVTLRNMFYQSDFEIEWMTPLLDDETNDKSVIARYLSGLLPYSEEDLMTRGLSLFLTKKSIRELSHQLKQTEKRLTQVQKQIELEKIEKEEVIGRVEAMESSKFWKLRSQWFWLKKTLGLPSNE